MAVTGQLQAVISTRAINGYGRVCSWLPLPTVRTLATPSPPCFVSKVPLLHIITTTTTINDK